MSKQDGPAGEKQPKQNSNSGDWPIGCSLFQCLDYGHRLTQEKQRKYSREADTIVTQLIQGPVTTGLGAKPDKQQQGVLVE